MGGGPGNRSSGRRSGAAVRRYFDVFLYLHVLAAIVGLGPTFAFGWIGRVGAEHPGQGLFAARIVHTLTRKMALPLATVILVTGVAMIWAAEIDFFEHGWLVLSTVLFVMSYGYSALVQSRHVGRLVEIGSGGGAQPSELPTLRRKIGWGGRYLRLSAAVILYLMIFKPF